MTHEDDVANVRGALPVLVAIADAIPPGTGISELRVQGDGLVALQLCPTEPHEAAQQLASQLGLGSWAVGLSRSPTGLDVHTWSGEVAGRRAKLVHIAARAVTR